jgi:hypothetical protein
MPSPLLPARNRKRPRQETTKSQNRKVALPEALLDAPVEYITMRIDCYLSPECASEEALRKNIKRALTIEKVEADLSFHRIDDNKAMALGVTGSPSVFINGKELPPQGLVGFS